MTTRELKRKGKIEGEIKVIGRIDRSHPEEYRSPSKQKSWMRLLRGDEMNRKNGMTIVAVLVLSLLIGNMGIPHIPETYAQPGLAWSRILGGPGYYAGFSVQQTTDGGYIIGGYLSIDRAGVEINTYIWS